MKIIPRIPIYIHPFFWIFSALIGFLMSQTIVGTVLWIIIIFISVLVHELGHALTSLIFKQNPKIELVAMGGLTSYQGKKLKYYQQFLIVLMGPVFGILLFGLATLILWLNFISNPTFLATIKVMQVVNLFWSIVNLLPILPLDGGQLLRIALEAFFGIKGFKLSLLLGFIMAAILALASFAVRYYLLGALFFLFAFQSFDMYRKSRNIQKCDRDEKLADTLTKAQVLIKDGKKDEAQKLLDDLRSKTKEGLIYVQATHLLAFLYYDQKDRKKAYEYFLSIKDEIADEAICRLHELAFEEANFRVVKELSASSYKLSPTQDIALKNAKAFAMLGEAKPSGGWLKTAMHFKKLDLNEVLKDKYFDKVKDDIAFRKFFKK
ncbi:MAG: Stage IV sporulation protein FB [Candidatus Anoxychlamydiales bacterium]|nr:Stage IV sporulation protein FB [Candidatus Anoxychlamydiales bacterium]